MRSQVFALEPEEVPDFPVHRHTVQFYESDNYLCEAVGTFLAPALRNGDPAIIIATPAHVEAFKEHLEMKGFNVQAGIDAGLLWVIDAPTMLSKLMDSGLPSKSRFEAEMRDVMERCKPGVRQRIYAYGEMVDILWREGNSDAAIRLEQLWNMLGDTYRFDLLCAYKMSAFNREAHHSALKRICDNHAKVSPTEQYKAVTHDDALREISLLQQKAIALEAESRDRTANEKQLYFLKAMIESADDAIVSKTLDGVVMSWNRGAERVFGYSAEEMVGKRIDRLIPSDQPDEEPQILEKLRRGEIIDHYETRRIRKDGKTIDISLTVSPIRNGHGRIVGASKIARDITERKRLESERSDLLAREQAARSKAEAADRVKQEFLDVLSHELRTPLHPILFWTRFLQHLPPTSSSAATAKVEAMALESIQRNAIQQNQNINVLLDTACLLSGKMVIESEAVDLPVVIKDAIESVSASAAAKEIRLDLEIDESFPAITGDRERLRQVLWHLLANSVKFTPRRGHVRIRLACSGQDVVIGVQDDGQGIGADFLPYVFDRFRQEDGGIARRQGGLGLGLAVVRYLVEAHGGTVSAESAGIGKGSTFTVRLPFQRS